MSVDQQGVRPSSFFHTLVTFPTNPVSSSLALHSLTLILTAMSAFPSLFSPQFLLYFSATPPCTQFPTLYPCY